MEKEVNINNLISNFKSNIIKDINESKLPGYLIYEIMNGLTLQIQNQLQSQSNDCAKNNN
jgi:hypothetical protein